MIQINLSNKSPENISQKFSFYTEESWATEKQEFSKNLHAVFSAKKNETFVIAEDDTLHFLIGIGNNPQNFDVQSVASNFSYEFRKKIQSVETLLDSQNLNAI